MTIQPKSIRPFIGSKNFELSKEFYTALDFEEHIINDDISYFEWAAFGFYLQNYYVEEWVNNTMVFLEVPGLSKYFEKIKALELDEKYKGARLSEIVEADWGNTFFLHDPSGVLWHIGEFGS